MSIMDKTFNFDELERDLTAAGAVGQKMIDEAHRRNHERHAIEAEIMANGYGGAESVTTATNAETDHLLLVGVARQRADRRAVMTANAAALAIGKREIIGRVDLACQAFLAALDELTVFEARAAALGSDERRTGTMFAEFPTQARAWYARVHPPAAAIAAARPRPILDMVKRRLLGGA